MFTLVSKLFFLRIQTHVRYIYCLHIKGLSIASVASQKIYGIANVRQSIPMKLNQIAIWMKYIFKIYCLTLHLQINYRTIEYFL